MHGYGGVEQLFFEDADEPKLSEPDEVIVKLKAASINHIDIWNRMGATGINVPMPHILGADGAGIVVEVGARVIVTSGSDEKLARAKNLGADHGVNHFKDEFTKVVNELTQDRGVDVVLDCVGGEVWRKSLASLARGGRLVTCGATAGGQPIDDIAAIVSKQLNIYGSTLGSRDEFRELISFMNATKIKPIIDSVFPLKDAASAQRYVEEAKQFGKVVLNIPE